MPVRLHCPKCGKKYTLADASKVTGHKCRLCKVDLVVSGHDSTASRTASATDSISERTSDSQEKSEFPAQIGRYKIRAQLGAGAFGRVYRAYDPNLEREVALKVLHPERLGNPKTVERFLREAAAGARLRHTYIVPVYDFSSEQGFIVAAYIKGRTLKDALEIDEWEFHKSAETVRKLALALHHAHHEGIVHRDVKPANILIDENGDPLLTDFGLASLHDAAYELTHDGTALGTPAYMAPEQYLGAKDKSVDQYSLGVMFFEMLCGELPFTGHPAARGLVDPPSLRANNPKIPANLEAICLKMLAKKPEDRYTHCKALADELQSWLDERERTAESRNPPPYEFPKQVKSVDREPLPMIDSPHRARDEQTATAARLGVDLSWTNTTGILFRLIPAGEYRAGPSLGDTVSRPDIRQFRVKIHRPFWVSNFPITNRVVAAFLDDMNEKTPLARDRLFAPAARTGVDDDLPAVNVNIADAAAVVQWLSQLDGRHYRLPTEGEWEFFARAGCESAMHPRMQLPPSTAPAPADSRRVNPFGLLDVIGNVSEWTATPFAAQPDGSTLTRIALAEEVGPHAVRGSSWRCKENELTLAWRKSVVTARRADDLGLRLVCEIEDKRVDTR